MPPRLLSYAQFIVTVQMIICAIWLICILLQPPLPQKYAGSALVGKWRDHDALYVLRADGTGRYTWHRSSAPLTWMAKNGVVLITNYYQDRSIEAQCFLDADQKTLHQTLLTVHRSYFQQEIWDYDAVETFHWKETLKKE